MARTDAALIDTDVASWLFARRGDHLAYRRLLSGRRLAVSFATIGELWGHADLPRSTWSDARRQDLRTFFSSLVRIPGDESVASANGPLHARLRSQVGTNDLWIAATALATDLPVATGYVNHFTLIASHERDLEILTLP